PSRRFGLAGCNVSRGCCPRYLVLRRRLRGIRFFWRIGSLETNGSGYPKNELVAAHHISHALSRRLASFSLPATRPRLKCGCVVRARYKWLRSGCGWVSLTVNPPHVCDSSRSKSALNETRRRIGETECRDGSRCRGSAHACGAIERLAVRGSPQDRGAAHAIPKDEVIFETGYGPSGLPHIGTFGEVARTTIVRHAFRVLTEDKV